MIGPPACLDLLLDQFERGPLDRAVDRVDLVERARRGKIGGDHVVGQMGEQHPRHFGDVQRHRAPALAETYAPALAFDPVDVDAVAADDDRQEHALARHRVKLFEDRARQGANIGHLLVKFELKQPISELVAIAALITDEICGLDQGRQDAVDHVLVHARRPAELAHAARILGVDEFLEHAQDALGRLIAVAGRGCGHSGIGHIGAMRNS